MTAPAPTPARRPDASMTLLTEMLERPLDPGYAAASARRAAAGGPRSTPVGSTLVAVTAILIGLLFAVSATTVRRGEASAGTVRKDLISQIESRRAVVDERSAAIRDRQTEITRLESNALGATENGLRQELQALAALTGNVAVEGPGLLVTLNDKPTDDATPTAGDDQGKVLSRDLFIVVNSLWQSGAEAIAINGQRLTVRSPIRFAGEAILVNFRPLSPPYVISAIGHPAALPAAFAETVGGAYLKSLTDNFGIVTSVEGADHISLPGATRVTVDKAVVQGGTK